MRKSSRRFNDALQKEVAFSDAERFTYKSVDNLEIEGWLMKPYGYQAGKKYPVVLYIHGGPHSAYGEGWFDEFQSLAGGGCLRAVHESARLERHERRVHEREPRRLGRQGLHRSHEGASTGRPRARTSTRRRWA